MGAIRFLFAISVVIAHVGKPFGYELINSGIAIHGFYIISGFYISLILTEKYIGKNGSFKLYITNRFLRIYPLYWLILLLTIIAGLFLAKGSIYKFDLFAPFISDYQNVGSLTLSGRVFSDLIRLVFLFPTQHYFIPNLVHFGNLIIPQSWTLGIELLFYLIAPLFVRRNIFIIFLLIIITFFIRFFVFRLNEFSGITINNRFFPGELVFFLLGVLAYRFYGYTKKYYIPEYLLVAPYVIVIIFTLVYTILPLTFFFFNLLQAAYFLVLIFSLSFNIRFTAKNKFDSLLANLSYPIYLCHYVVIILLGTLFIKIDKNVFIIMSIGASIFSGWVIYKILEKPIDILRQKRLS